MHVFCTLLPAATPDYVQPSVVMKQSLILLIPLSKATERGLRDEHTSHATQVIVQRMMGYLRTSIDEHIRRDISRKVSVFTLPQLCA
jgi:hypothetical protein